jgi:hypothetical protein
MQCPRPARIAWCLALVAGCGSTAQPAPTVPDAAVPEERADAWPWANAEAGGFGPDAALAPDAPPAPDAQPVDVLGPAPNDALPPTSACGAETAPLRRLTNGQYVRTVRELTGVTLTTALPSTNVIDGFEDRVEVQDNSPLQVEAWSLAAEEVATALSTRLPALTGCATIDDACARSFITSFGLRAYRRPLTPAEVEAHFAVYTNVKMLGDASDGVLAVLRVMLQSPHLLYRPEILGTIATGRLYPTPFETATRLSYFLWGNTPDAALLAAAARNELATPAQLAAQIQRMLLDSRARQGTNDFIRQWLDVDRVQTVQRDPAVFPTWNAALAAAMREEGYRFAQRVIFDGDGRLGTLLTSTEGIVNGPLAQLYGVTITGTDWQPVNLPKQQRMGLLTQGWFLAGRSSIATRGVLVRDRLFCQQIPPPPPGLDPTPPPRMPGTTTREYYQGQLVNPACLGCHTLFDQLGFTFENYDAIGAFRTTESGKPIDSSGVISGTEDSDGPITGAATLSARLAASAQVRDCVASRWYGLAVGREIDSDDCRASEVKRSFRAGAGNLRDLMTTIALDAARRPRPAAEVSSASGAPLIVNPGDQRNVGKIVLDLLGSQLAQLRQRLALPLDRMHLDQHQSGLRELEKKF